MTHAEAKQHAHELIERMAPGQVSALVGLLELMIDPVAYSLANAPCENEPVSEEENLAVAASNIWLKNNEPIPHAELLAEFGLSPEEFERMGRTPVEP